MDFKDPQGGGDYFTAGSQLAALVDQNSGNPNASVSAIPYFEHIFSYMANVVTSSCPTPGQTATQAVYCNEWAPNHSNGLGESGSLLELDFYCNYGCPPGHRSRFWQDQFSSLYSLSTMGTSSYNAGQVTLRHPMSHGLQADLSYTYSRSLDLGSDAERANQYANGVAYAQSEIINSWKPYLNKGVSDFDTTHLLTVDYVYQLPFGRGAAMLGNSNRLVNAVIGGWQLSGILRATSGLPFTLTEPGYTTNWQQPSYGVVVGQVKIRRHFDQNGNPQFFDNPTAINEGINSGSPIRLPYPGETGERNNFRGDGYFGLDSGLSKGWSISDYGKLKFTWEVYNVTNAVRFDVANGFGNTLSSGNLGIASATLTVPRRMQFSLRFDF